MISSLPHVLLALLPVVLAAPAPVPVQIPAQFKVAVVPHPMITPPPSLSNSRVRRDIISDAKSDIEGLGTYLSGVIGTFPSYIASGVPNFFQGFPTGTAVQSSLGISDDDLKATPTQVLNIP